MKEKILNLSKELNEQPYIKSFPILRYAGLTPGQTKIIEYILSYQFDGKPCYPYQDTIALMCNLKVGSVRTMICILSDEELIMTVNKKNFNRKTGKGGSKSTYAVNLELLEAKIRSNPEFIRATEEAQEDDIPQPQPKKKNIKKSTTPKVNAHIRIEAPIKPAVDGIPVAIPKPSSEKMNRVLMDGAEDECATGTCSSKRINMTKPKFGDMKKIELAPDMYSVIKMIGQYLRTKYDDRHELPYNEQEIVETIQHTPEEINKTLGFFKQNQIIKLFKNDDNVWCISINGKEFKCLTGIPFEPLDKVIVIKPKKLTPEDELEQVRAAIYAADPSIRAKAEADKDLGNDGIIL